MATTKKLSKPKLDRPFAAKVLKQAHEAVQAYEVVLQQEEDGTWFGRGVEMPGAMGDGKTAEACMTSVREAMEANAAYMLEKGDPLPLPARKEKRDSQVNIRLTWHERLRLDALAAAQGFASVSDFMRIRSLSFAS